ncbi:hypothetical protein GOP47_0002956 [Adiantum capillus-veneris]|uniref:Uncharacterized protein n=1 Tax=Adiantum capillus-veneris TaxID=13818 RepID=A0A9D4ZPM9_ADICA|nr:hypothetical protein GOP47_0002956 [Adiantum capillus-veneris]
MLANPKLCSHAIDLIEVKLHTPCSSKWTIILEACSTLQLISISGKRACACETTLESFEAWNCYECLLEHYNCG